MGLGIHDYWCEECDEVVEDHNSKHHGHATCPDCGKEMEIVWHPIPFSIK